MSRERKFPPPSLLFRVLIAGVCTPFWISGIDKLLDLNGAAKELADIGMGHPEVVALIVIAVQIGGSILSIFGRGMFAALGAVALAAFTAAATLIAHAFWTLHGQERFGQMNIFIEHISIVFGLLSVAWAHVAPFRTSAERAKSASPVEDVLVPRPTAARQTSL